MSVHKRISAIQHELSQRSAFACIIPSGDPHVSEYVAPRWEGRAWASGFHGSAGTLVVCVDSAALWTDGRYFLEAARVLEGSGIELMKMGLPQTPEISQWIIQQSAEKKVGENRSVLVAEDSFPLSLFNGMGRELSANGLELKAQADILDAVWADRPELPGNALYEISSELTGQTRAQRLALLREWVKDAGGGSFLISALDEIAWILNLRGSDVDCNPVFYAYLLVDPDKAVLFVSPSAVDKNIAKALKADGVECREYGQIFGILSEGVLSPSVFADPTTLNVAAASAIGDVLKPVGSPIRQWKACKSDVELEATRNVMERDGAAMVRLLHWIERQIEAGQVLTELEISRKVSEFRSADSQYVGDSFESIVGFGPNGAVVHYRVDEESSLSLDHNGLLLIDSGGQYRDGTTDITRTVSVGEASAEQIRHFTLVLKGHINLARAKFPRGTFGVQLDTFARKYLWQEGLDYRHGTGHGVGFALNVHEGPQSISTKLVNQPLLPGMICSNEPGYYQADSHGIRIENLLAVRATENSDEFLDFENLTLCPIELELINRSMLFDEEIRWINEYHQMVWKRLSPLLDSELRLWLQHKTRKL